MKFIKQLIKDIQEILYLLRRENKSLREENDKLYNDCKIARDELYAAKIELRSYKRAGGVWKANN